MRGEGLDDAGFFRRGSVANVTILGRLLSASSDLSERGADLVGGRGRGETDRRATIAIETPPIRGAGDIFQTWRGNDR